MFSSDVGAGTQIVYASINIIKYWESIAVILHFSCIAIHNFRKEHQCFCFMYELVSTKVGKIPIFTQIRTSYRERATLLQTLHKMRLHKSLILLLFSF